MRKWPQTLIIVSTLLSPLSGCWTRKAADDHELPQAKVEAVPSRPTEADKVIANLPDVLGLRREPYRDNGPRIMIWVNGALYVDTTLRDNEEVTADQLGNYLARIAFADTKKVSIRADDSDPKKASLKSKFELRLRASRRDGDPDVLRISFDEMQFRKSISDPTAWVLTGEAIELIEKAIPQKKSDS